MTNEVLTIGEKERDIIFDWYITLPVRSCNLSKFTAFVQAALDEIDYDFKVAFAEKYTRMEYALYLAYSIAIGKAEFDDIYDRFVLRNDFDLFLPSDELIILVDIGGGILKGLYD